MSNLVFVQSFLSEIQIAVLYFCLVDVHELLYHFSIGYTIVIIPFAFSFLNIIKYFAQAIKRL